MEGLGVNPAFWRGRRVFLTGHTGFKGSWLALWLDRLGADVTGYALAPPTEPNLYEVTGIESRLTSIRADIRDAEMLRASLKEARPTVVMHLAAQSLVREAYEAPLATYETNVMGTANLLDAVRDAPGVEAVLVVTSDKCYENRELDRPFTEDDPMGGADPYSSSKGCAELLTASYRTCFFRDAGAARIATARAGNVIGGGDWARDRLVPDVIAAIAAGKPVEIRYPDAVRPWQHVLEPLHGYLLLAEALCHRQPGAAAAWNFGPPDDAARPVRWIAETLTRAWGEGADWTEDRGTHPREAGFLRLDAAKARTQLDWHPLLDLETALEWVVAWFRAHREGNDMCRFSLDEIARYEQRLGATA